MLESRLEDLSPRLKVCAGCGAEFRCGAGTGARAGHCWCEDMPLLTSLSGGDCMCPDCLAKAVKAASSFRG
jgi:hypothetical protein